MITFKNVPTSFVLENWQNAVNHCDEQTTIFCYCGKLATGLHTSSCKKFLRAVQNFITERYKETIKQG